VCLILERSSQLNWEQFFLPSSHRQLNHRKSDETAKPETFPLSKLSFEILINGSDFQVIKLSANSSEHYLTVCAFVAYIVDI
jgi:hypothetical protein